MSASRQVPILACLLAAALLAQTGCWGRKFFRMPSESLETSAKADSLLRVNSELRRRMAAMEQSLEQQQEYSRRTNAQLKIDIEELKDQINMLQEMLRYTGSSEGAAGIRDRTPPREDTSVGTRETPGSLPDGLTGVSPDSLGADSAGVAASMAAPPPAEEIHRQMYLDFSRGEFQLALEESEVFLEEYPDHRLVEEVLFIRGECFMEQKKHFDALKEFSRILQDFPSGERVPPSLLRMAIAYEDIGEREIAGGIARRLIREHPYSEEAAVAQDRFGELLKE
ncbi:MAG TPA: tetratricopeptide repeat protein [Candidatus Eisenbacteria bacterium]|uniref:Tetratricopeptide repeat protein n=1 Tax=Eiseniibacteriota bacterium TaxID=2212470 RepID=A0A7V2F2W6_UNCEI|nr:tetratricopeptide repeat protein [Candidatus Eisenbacteria bacterium]